MDQLSLKPRKAVQEIPVENWDDDDDLDIGGDDLTFRSASFAGTTSSQHRESVSSRLSIRSDFDSVHGDDEKQVHLPGDDEKATCDAIATATMAGIPIPQNVPSSALLGGTIKRLGGRKIKKFIQDDWDDGDIEIPMTGALKIKQQDSANFPDALRQVSGPRSIPPSPMRLQPAPILEEYTRPGLKVKPASTNLALDRYRDSDETLPVTSTKPVSSRTVLDRFRDDDDDDDFFGDGGATIKVPKSRSARKMLPFVTPPTPQKKRNQEDDFESDIQLPNDGKPLQLQTRREPPQTPFNVQDEFEDWGEGSLGTRFGGTRRDARSSRSNRSSSAAMSPSAASSFTAESEDEGLDGLVLPNGPIAFEDILRRRQTVRSPEPALPERQQPTKHDEPREDFETGLDFGDGDFFASKKRTANRNVKISTVKAVSPTRPKSTVTLTFTNKPTSAPISRLPRPMGHDRVPSSLEPVSESGAPIPHRRSQTRMGHSAQSSVNSVGTPSTPHFATSLAPATPRRRDLLNKHSNTSLRNDPTTTNSQILKLKRSMPSMPEMRSMTASPARTSASRFERPPSRTETSSRQMSRPKTPGSGAQGSLSHTRKHPVPFIPGGGVPRAQPLHNASNPFRRRHDSESSSTTSHDLRPTSRAVSRTLMRSPSPYRSKLVDGRARTIAEKQSITRPLRKKHYGDGAELEGFDDLPISRDAERRFEKAPIGFGGPKLRRPPSRTTTPTPLSPAKSQNLPRFAQDTNASRKAREYVLAQRAPSAAGTHLPAPGSQWKTKVSSYAGMPSGSIRSKKPKSPQRPMLIKGFANNPEKKSKRIP